MKDSVYHLLEKKGGLSKLSIAHMNEHRRKKRSLPPLTAIDYNCMDRASLKLKLVFDTLALQRRISGLYLAPRNLAQLKRERDYDHKRRVVNYELMTKPLPPSIRLLLLWGPAVEIAPEISPKATMIQASGPQV